MTTHGSHARTSTRVWSPSTLPAYGSGKSKQRLANENETTSPQRRRTPVPSVRHGDVPRLSEGGCWCVGSRLRLLTFSLLTFSQKFPTSGKRTTQSYGSRLTRGGTSIDYFIDRSKRHTTLPFGTSSVQQKLYCTKRTKARYDRASSNYRPAAVADSSAAAAVEAAEEDAALTSPGTCWACCRCCPSTALVGGA